jgi:hypothetical protein
MSKTNACASCARTLNRAAVKYRQWAMEYEAKGRLDAARRWEKEARTRFEDAAWWIGRARRLSDG